MRSFCPLSLVLSVFLLSCSPSQAEHSYGRRHRHINNLTFDAKNKRDANVAFTYFNVGQGACGATNSPSDFIVALNSAEYDGGAHCFEMITITIDGKTVQAQITDECPGCSTGGLDLSEGLFKYFAPLSQGELHGSWSYNSDITSSSSTPTPTTTIATPSLTPTTTTISSSAVLSATITTSFASTNIPSPSPTSTTSTVPTSTPQDPEIIMQIDLALLELGALLQVSLQL